MPPLKLRWLQSHCLSKWPTMTSEQHPHLMPAEAAQAKKIQDKLAHLSAEQQKQALEILRQIAQKQAKDPRKR